MATNLKTVRLTITRTNDTGFQCAEQPGQWLNISKYARPAPVVPPVGTRVDAVVDPRGFVMAIEPVRENDVVDGATIVGAPTSIPAAISCSTRTATRLAILEIAARFLATRPEAKAADVLGVAEMWEGWISGERTASAGTMR